MNKKTHAGYIAIVGRPNVGKSTLLNRILGEKIAITSRKPQTTRQQMLGIQTNNGMQAIYVDTPGLHHTAKKAMNRYMNRQASSAIFDVDVIVFVVDSDAWYEDDDLVLNKVLESELPVVLVINKIDKIKEKDRLLPVMQSLGKKMSFAHIVPVSAKSGAGVDELESILHQFLPEGPFFFDEEKKTDKQVEFLITERIREKIVRYCGQELPYTTAVEVEAMKKEKKILHVHALIWVEREGQKAIVIGKNGERLKKIGTDARIELEKTLGEKIFLQLWVKCKDQWSDNDAMLSRLGMDK